MGNAMQGEAAVAACLERQGNAPDGQLSGLSGPQFVLSDGTGRIVVDPEGVRIRRSGFHPHQIRVEREPIRVGGVAVFDYLREGDEVVVVGTLEAPDEGDPYRSMAQDRVVRPTRVTRPASILHQVFFPELVTGKNRAWRSRDDDLFFLGHGTEAHLHRFFRRRGVLVASIWVLYALPAGYLFARSVLAQ